jgi:hypothetical protein
MQKYSIYCQHILTEGMMVSGYVCVKGEFISRIVEEKHALQVEAALLKYPLLHDFKNLIVMAGGIDTNIALSPGKEGWDHTEAMSAY